MKKPTNDDSLFAEPREKIIDFTFDDSVAHVFPDMITRSVPGYATVVTLTGLLAERYAQPNSNCYDLGCSLGAVSLSMRQRIQQSHCRIIAVDSALAMVERCRQNVAGDDTLIPIDVVHADIGHIDFQRASFVVLNYTLQFIPPSDRLRLLKKIGDGMLPGGALIISEKIAFDDPEQHVRQSALHHAFKKANGYSEMEISQKRKALEKVLIPDSLSSHVARIKKAGFSHCDVWFQCFNFMSLLVIK